MEIISQGKLQEFQHKNQHINFLIKVPAFGWMERLLLKHYYA